MYKSIFIFRNVKCNTMFKNKIKKMNIANSIVPKFEEFHEIRQYIKDSIAFE